MYNLNSYVQSWARRGWVGVAWVVFIAWAPAQVVNSVVASVFDRSSDDVLFRSPFKMILAGLLIAPLIETLTVKYMFLWGGRYCRDPILLNCICAVLWGAAHVTSSGLGVHAVWAFFIMGAYFQEILKVGSDRALLLTSMVHALFNLVSYVAYLLFE